MIRIVAIGAILFGAGAAAGWLAAPAVDRAVPPPQVETPVIVAPADGNADALRAERDRLEEENEYLAMQVTQLLDQQADWLSGAMETAPEANAALAESPEEPRDRSRRPDWDSEEMQARREEFMRENARRMQEFDDWIASQITDRDGIEAYNALIEWREHQGELRDQFRDAQTDEERDAIRAKMDDARRTARRMVEDQQDAMLRSVAAANGVSDRARQDEFVSAMRETLENPFFELEGMLAGDGRGGFSWGGGGGRRGGGRPPGQFQAGGQTSSQ